MAHSRRVSAPPNPIPLPPEPLGKLAARAQAGQESAIRALLERLVPLVRQTCRGVLGAWHPDTEDAIQESLVGVLDALHDYRFEGEFAHYAIRISLRMAVRAKRRAAARIRRLELLRTSPQGPGNVSPDAAVENEQGELVRELVLALPDPQAEALWLRIVLGFTLEEAARIADVPLNTLKTRLRLAKSTLRRRIRANPRARALFDREGP